MFFDMLVAFDCYLLLLGEHIDELLCELGYGVEWIVALRDGGVVC